MHIKYRPLLEMENGEFEPIGDIIHSTFTSADETARSMGFTPQLHTWMDSTCLVYKNEALDKLLVMEVITCQQ